MVAQVELGSWRLSAAHHQDFLLLLPAIRRQAFHAFRQQRASLREELLSEVVAKALVGFARLVARGKTELAYATPLAQFAIRQVRAGRRVGNPANQLDLTSDWGPLISSALLAVPWLAPRVAGSTASGDALAFNPNCQRTRPITWK